MTRISFSQKSVIYEPICLSIIHAFQVRIFFFFLIKSIHYFRTRSEPRETSLGECRPSLYCSSHISQHAMWFRLKSYCPWHASNQKWRLKDRYCWRTGEYESGKLFWCIHQTLENYRSSSYIFQQLINVGVYNAIQNVLF